MNALPNPFNAKPRFRVKAICISSSCGGAESRSVDMSIGSHGLTDAHCKWPLSRCEGETTTSAGVAPGPQDSNTSAVSLKVSDDASAAATPTPQPRSPEVAAAQDFPDIPFNLKRDADNVAPYARAG